MPIEKQTSGSFSLTIIDQINGGDVSHLFRQSNLPASQLSHYRLYFTIRQLLNKNLMHCRAY